MYFIQVFLVTIVLITSGCAAGFHDISAMPSELAGESVSKDEALKSGVVVQPKGEEYIYRDTTASDSNYVHSEKKNVEPREKSSLQEKRIGKQLSGLSGVIKSASGTDIGIVAKASPEKKKISKLKRISPKKVSPKGSAGGLSSAAGILGSINTVTATAAVGDHNISLAKEGEPALGVVKKELSSQEGDYSEIALAAPASESIFPNKKLENYSVIVAADSEISIPGPPGEMRVWIGSPDSEPKFDTDMSIGKKDIPAISDTAKVTPYTPGIEVEPKVSICEKIDPSGSEVRFQLKPKEKGTFDIGADVALYASDDCTGTPIPKTAASIQVKVVVNTMKKIEQGKDEIVTETWKGILDFWKELIGVISALLLFLIRKKLYKLFGFKSGKDS